jgi:TRAP-type C4-dicarboxylate transport system substrate-binding protein
MLVAAGASISSMPSNEIYTGLQTGVLDATNTSSASFVSFRLYEQVKCLTAPGENALWFMYEPVLMSKKVFGGLSKAQQDAIMAAGKVSEEYFDAESRKSDAKLADGLSRVFCVVSVLLLISGCSPSTRRRPRSCSARLTC